MLRRMVAASVLGAIAFLSARCAPAQQAAPPPPAPIPAAGEPLQPGEVIDPSQVASRWPLHIPNIDGEIVVFQPQLEDFQGDVLTGRSAVSVTTSKQQQPLYGAVWLKSRVATDRTAR